MTIEEIARRLGGAIEGNAQALISRLAGIREAEQGDLTFVATPHYAGAAATTRATAVIVNEDWSRPCAATLIRVKSADKAFAEAAQWFAPPPVPMSQGIHPTAILADDVKLGQDVSIGPYAVLEAGVSVGSRSIISAQCYIGHGTTVGEDCRFYPQVTVREYTRIGNRTILHNGTVVGSDGFGYTQEGALRKKIPQIGIVVIGDDVEIGANVTIDRARFGQTRIGNGVKMDNLIQIAHNVIIGDNCVIVAQAGISGSTMIGERTIIAGQVGIVGHLVIGPDVIVAAQAGVTKDIAQGTFVLGSPAMPYEKFTKLHAHLMRLPEIKEKIAAMAERLARLEQTSGSKPSGT